MPQREKHGQSGCGVLAFHNHVFIELNGMRRDVTDTPALEHATWTERTKGIVAMTRMLQVFGGSKKKK